MSSMMEDALVAVRRAYESSEARIAELTEELREARADAERAEDERADLVGEKEEAEKAAAELLRDKEVLLRLVGMTEHEFDAERSRLLFETPEAFLRRRVEATAAPERYPIWSEP